MKLILSFPLHAPVYGFSFWFRCVFPSHPWCVKSKFFSSNPEDPIKMVCVYRLFKQFNHFLFLLTYSSFIFKCVVSEVWATTKSMSQHFFRLHFLFVIFRQKKMKPSLTQKWSPNDSYYCSFSRSISIERMWFSFAKKLFIRERLHERWFRNQQKWKKEFHSLENHLKM